MTFNAHHSPMLKTLAFAAGNDRGEALCPSQGREVDKTERENRVITAGGAVRIWRLSLVMCVGR